MSIETAQKFAALLHAGHYDDAAHLLDENCTYHYAGKNHKGRHTIINLYRSNEEKLRGQFAEVTLSSRFEEASDGLLEVHFHDKVRRGHRWHEMKSYDSLTLRDAKIVHIEHHFSPAEEEAFLKFFHESGVEL